MNKVNEFLTNEEAFLDEMYADNPDEDISFEELNILLEMEDFFREHGRAPTYEEMSRVLKNS